MDNAGYERPIGQCDRCGRVIRVQNGTNVLVLTVSNYKWDEETFHLKYMICGDCHKDFDSWLIEKLRE